MLSLAHQPLPLPTCSHACPGESDQAAAPAGPGPLPATPCTLTANPTNLNQGEWVTRFLPEDLRAYLRKNLNYAWFGNDHISYIKY